MAGPLNRPRRKRRENVAEQKQTWFAEAYDFLANDVVASPGHTRKPVRKVALDRIRELMVEREHLTAEDGKLPAQERTAFKRAKEHFLAGENHGREGRLHMANLKAREEANMARVTCRVTSRVCHATGGIYAVA